MTVRTDLHLFRFASLTALAVAIATPAHAQEDGAVPPADDTGEAPMDEILVVADRLVGRVDAPQPPILELGEEDIATYGAGSIAELVEALGPQVNSGRGRGDGPPAFLINGLRVSSFREMRSYPPEAINRVEVLPEEVAQRYGFAPDQRVINFILKDNFSSREVELEYGQPTDGGYSAKEIEATLLQISGSSRLNINLEVSDTTLLTEEERDVVLSAAETPAIATDPDPTAYRSLVADSTDYELTANWTTGLGDSGASLSLNGTAERNDSHSLAGLTTALLVAPDGSSALRSLGADNPLDRRSQTDTLSFGATLNAYAGDWQLTGTVDASHARSESKIDRRADTSELVAAAAAGTLDIAGPLPVLADAGYDEALSTSNNASVLFTAVSNPLLLPAGEVSTTIDAGYDWTRIESEDTRNPGLKTQLTRGDLSAGINLGVPLTSRWDDVLAFAGDITLNLGAGVNHLSDFGTLADWTTGLNWGITERLNLQASYIFREAAPSLSQLGAPEVVNLNTPVYDFNTGDTVLAQVITGGNPDLVEETQSDWRIAAFWDIPLFDRSSLLVEYNRNRSEDVTSAFPLLTPAIEAAFPTRVSRDAEGRLLAIDQRPITLAEQESSRLRYGINLSGQLGREPEEAEGRGGPGARGPRGPGGPRPDVGRWNLSLTHTIELDNEVLIAEGGPLLDLLEGDALSGGGVSRHTVSLRGGAFYSGFGLRASANYESPSDVNGTDLPGSNDLRFGSLATLDLRLFADLGRQASLVESSSIFENMRVSLSMDNVFDQRREVTDENGNVPLRYQPFLIDPVGRFIEFEVRKLF